MEACAENGKKIIVLDRPNPNGMYVDGPILDTAFRSFVGMQRIPVVYGMTCGEYAQMLKGESWINKAKNLQLQVIKCSGWNHNSTYNLPVPPSPNLRTANAIALYPSICFFEGTVVSLGRGTDKPFEQWGHPAYEGKFTDTFRPESVVGARNPPMEGKLCYGKDLTLQKDTVYTLRLTWLIEAYKAFPQKDSFFNNFFEKLAGTNMLRSQIVEGKDENTIRRSWATGIQQFKAIRKKYLLYKDFE
jgi:uncharacterized protein YbbC (DUF1343 family)